MNTSLSLAQFCEVHGPNVIFFTTDDHEFETSENEAIGDDANQHTECPSCESIGPNQTLYSDVDNEQTERLISRERVHNESLRKYLKQAAIRILSCEIINSRGDGSSMLYGDADLDGFLVLSHVFRIPDAKARGYYRTLAVILVTDQQIPLFAMWTDFIDFIVQGVIEKIRAKADIKLVLDREKGETRSARIQSGRAGTSPPRTLHDICDWPDIWEFLHQNFCQWLIKFKRQCVESLTESDVDSQSNDTYSNIMSLRDVMEHLGIDNFKSLCYCLLTGIQVVIRSKNDECLLASKCLELILPHRAPFCHSDVYLSPENAMLLSMNLNVAVPQSSHRIYRVDILGDLWIVKWQGTVTKKLPQLVQHILEVVLDQNIDNETLHAHITSLMYKWQNIVRVNFWTEKASNKKLLHSAMAVTDDDVELLKYWDRYVQADL